MAKYKEGDILSKNGLILQIMFIFEDREEYFVHIKKDPSLEVPMKIPFMAWPMKSLDTVENIEFINKSVYKVLYGDKAG